MAQARQPLKERRDATVLPEDMSGARPPHRTPRLIEEAKTESADQGEYRQVPISGERSGAAGQQRADRETFAEEPAPVSAFRDEVFREGAEVGRAAPASTAESIPMPRVAAEETVPARREKLPGGSLNRLVGHAPSEDGSLRKPTAPVPPESERPGRTAAVASRESSGPASHEEGIAPSAAADSDGLSQAQGRLRKRPEGLAIPLPEPEASLAAVAGHTAGRDAEADESAADELQGASPDAARDQPVLETAGSDLPPSGPQVPARSSSSLIPSPIPSSIPSSIQTAAPRAESLTDEKDAAREPFSTFSLHVSDVSFELAQAVLARGQWPRADRIRIEEFVNAFDYGDPMPSQAAKVSCRLEQAIHPFLQQRNLLRIAIRTAAAGRAGATPLRLTFLLDTSGSMERFDRRETVRRAFALLAAQLQPSDRITLIGFARQPRLVADGMSGAEGARLGELVAELPSEGGTNLEAGLRLAFEKAREQQVPGAQNRVVLMTDGAANLGDADPERLARLVVSMRQAGIAFDAAGIGANGLNDAILEALTRQGDGRYYLLDRPDDADAGFARQIAGALRPAARNVKVQVEFNPARVGGYRLLGFEKHRLREEDFRDDSVDAAELAAAEAGVALYQLEARPHGQGDVGSVSVRFQDTESARMIERRWPIPYEPRAPRLEASAPSQRLAAAAALFAARLGDDPLGQLVELPVLARLVAGLPAGFRNMQRVTKLSEMIERARRMESVSGQ